MSRKTLFTIAFLAAVISFFTINYLITKEKIYKEAFSGKIKRIKYDAKSQPTVTIDGKKHGFPFGREKGDFMVDDSLVKKANTTVIYQYREGKLIKKYFW